MKIMKKLLFLIIPALLFVTYQMKSNYDFNSNLLRDNLVIPNQNIGVDTNPYLPEQHIPDENGRLHDLPCHDFVDEISCTEQFCETSRYSISKGCYSKESLEEIYNKKIAKRSSEMERLGIELICALDGGCYYGKEGKKYNYNDGTFTETEQSKLCSRYWNLPSGDVPVKCMEYFGL